ncbi:MAG: hypothetical protein A2498_09350 [Lentisphaerae bacterium RIFOXYC12_FULL_60_16]|nr:MAG: hypothetical protein A2498_09350 [Lentisphaerae bacterium RIFOXYC12_FULL_60_16]
MRTPIGRWLGLGLLIIGTKLMAQNAVVPETPTNAVRLLVVMKQTEIRGQVFLIQEGEKKVVSADNVAIEVLHPARQGRILQTHTDTAGHFTLPNLEVGDYLLHVGKLNLELRVEDPQLAQVGVQQVPKSIILFLPESLTY